MCFCNKGQFLSISSQSKNCVNGFGISIFRRNVPTRAMLCSVAKAFMFLDLKSVGNEVIFDAIKLANELALNGGGISRGKYPYCNKLIKVDMI